MISLLNKKAYTLVEIILTMSIGAIVVTFVGLGLFTFRDNVEYDILLTRTVESVNFAKIKALSARLDSQGSRTSYSVRFFEDRIVEFEGDVYTEGADTNVEYEVPIGLRLSSICSPTNNGIVTFSAVTGENSNFCTVDIYKVEEGIPTGSIIIRRQGVEQAS